MKNSFYKQDDKDHIWLLEQKEQKGKFLFSFDRKKIYNFFDDYPDKLTPEEKKIFDKEYPELAELR